VQHFALAGKLRGEEKKKPQENRSPSENCRFRTD